MQVKASLHIHTKEDVVEGILIHHTIYDLIDRAKKTGFKVLGLTCHDKFVYKKEFGDYAKSKGILLIPGIELNIQQKRIGGGHVVVLNCDNKIDEVKTFDDLIAYKKKNPDIFIIAAHPNPNSKFAVGLKLLVKYIKLFDAIENTWVYSKWFNINRKPRKIAKKYKKPFIATSDLHSFNYKFFETDYIIVELDRLTVNNFFNVIKKKKFKNVTAPKNFFEALYLAISTFLSSLFVLNFHNAKSYIKQRKEDNLRYRSWNS